MNSGEVRSKWKLNNRNAIKRSCLFLYYRNDIHCGLSNCKFCSESAIKPFKIISSNRILVPNGYIFIHHLDSLTEWINKIAGIIVLDSIMKSIQNSHTKIYLKLKELIESDSSFYLLSDRFIPGIVEENDNLCVSQGIIEWYKPHGEDVLVFPLDCNSESSFSIFKLAADCSKEIPESVEKNWYLDRLDYLEQGNDENYFPEHLSSEQILSGIYKGEFYQGSLRMARGSFTVGMVQTSKGEFVIRGLRNLNRAINGDIVAISPVHASECVVEDDEDEVIGLEGGGEDEGVVPEYINIDDKLVGRVVGIISRNNKEIVGSLHPLQLANTSKIIFIPIDPRIPFINVKTKLFDKMIGKRITLKITDWPANSKRPNGYWVRILGNIGDVDVESNAILIENAIVVSHFSDSAQKELPKETWTAEPEPNRIEWDDCTVSVDPPGCTDIDDALSYKNLGDKLRIGVHIADVSYFVKDGSALDMEAYQRCNTVYMVDRRHEMLPSLLTSNICSLRSEVKRYAFSVIWLMDLEGNILETKFTKTIIQSSASLTYEEAQQIIDNPKACLNNDVRESLCGLLAISTKLRQRRIDRGALELSSTEVVFEFDETCSLTCLRPYKHYQTNKMVEEFMLLANTSVAEELVRSFPFVPIRRHPLPQVDRLTHLNNTLKESGVEQLNYENSKTLNESLKRISQKHPQVEKILRTLGTRCMSQALYSNSNTVPKNEWHHYGLCVDVYTHFTSPIRRYADILVHRLLAALLEISTIPSNWNRRLTESCDRMNEKHFAAKSCSRASMELFSYYVFRKSGPKETTGFITAIGSNRVTVMCPEYGIHVRAKTTTTQDSKRKLFDKVNVVLEAHDKYSRLSVAALVQ